jgi:magnesium-transporting ATPase (P-type)
MSLAPMFIIQIIYVITTRTYFLKVMIFHENLNFFILIFVYCFIFLGLLNMYIRILLIISIFIYELSLRYKIYVLDPNDNPKSDYNFIKKEVHNHHHNHNHFNRTAFTRASFFVTLAGCFISAGALYYANQANNLAREANNLAREANNHAATNSYEMTRQNDLEALGQGLMSREDFFRKYPQNKPKD